LEYSLLERRIVRRALESVVELSIADADEQPATCMRDASGPDRVKPNKFDWPLVGNALAAENGDAGDDNGNDNDDDDDDDDDDGCDVVVGTPPVILLASGFDAFHVTVLLELELVDDDIVLTAVCLQSVPPLVSHRCDAT
jgi:hypothetical protein